MKYEHKSDVKFIITVCNIFMIEKLEITFFK